MKRNARQRKGTLGRGSAGNLNMAATEASVGGKLGGWSSVA